MTDNVEIENIEFSPRGNAAEDAENLERYMQELLVKLFDEQDCFSGKHPFGNSGWTYDLYAELIKQGKIPGELDEYNDVVTVDEAAAFEYICDFIYGMKFVKE